MRKNTNEQNLKRLSIWENFGVGNLLLEKTFSVCVWSPLKWKITPFCFNNNNAPLCPGSFGMTQYFHRSRDQIWTKTGPGQSVHTQPKRLLLKKIISPMMYAVQNPNIYVYWGWVERLTSWLKIIKRARLVCPRWGFDYDARGRSQETCNEKSLKRAAAMGKKNIIQKRTIKDLRTRMK